MEYKRVFLELGLTEINVNGCSAGENAIGGVKKLKTLFKDSFWSRLVCAQREEEAEYLQNLRAARQSAKLLKTLNTISIAALTENVF